MRLAWLTDPHFNHADLPAWERLVDQLRRSGTDDGLLLTGDISEGDDVTFQLQRLAAAISRPVYFVLGNHDYYQSSVGETRRRIVDLVADHPWLHYLTGGFVVPLSDQLGLVGEDGWGDATVGDYDASPVRLADFTQIDDFRASSADRWRQQLEQLGRESADRLSPKLLDALDRFSTVVVLTHVPPFRQACWYEGRTTDDLWAPFFVCGQVGQVLQQAADAHPSRQLLVLCGHTHHEGRARITANLTVVTGGARYGWPAVSGVLHSDGEKWSVEV